MRSGAYFVPVGPVGLIWSQGVYVQKDVQDFIYSSSPEDFQTAPALCVVTTFTAPTLPGPAMAIRVVPVRHYMPGDYSPVTNL